MAKKSSDSLTPDASPGAVHERRDAAVFVVASDAEFLSHVRSQCEIPAQRTRIETLAQLGELLSEFERINLAFVLIVERSGEAIDPPALRRLRLDFPQLVIIAILDECDQRSSLRLQSIGVHSILLPPFGDIDIAREIATAIPNVPQFKRHPDLMRRGQARVDFVIPSDLAYVLGINHTVSLLLKEFGFPLQDVRVNIPLACDEAITNAIVHGNRRDPDKKVSVKIYVSYGRFRIRISDQGEGFDVSAVEDPREGDNVHRASGRGVFLMKNIMDTVEYKEGGRVLELEKLNTHANGNHNHKS